MFRLRISIISILLLINIAGKADELTLCQAFDNIYTSSLSSFSEIKLQKINTSKEEEWHSSIEIKNAEYSKIVSFLNEIYFEADLGTYATYGLASRRLDSIKTDFQNCKSGYSFVTSIDLVGGMDQHFFKKDIENGFCHFNAYFFIFKGSKGCTLYFKFSSNNPSSDFHYLTCDKKEEKIFSDLRSIEAERKLGFEKFKGQEDNTQFSLTTKIYTSNFCPDQCSGCFIQTANYAKFVIPGAINVSREEAEKASQLLYGIACYTLGSEYLVTISSNKNTIGFVHKNRPAIPKNYIMQVVIIKQDNGNYNAQLEVLQPRKS